MRLFKRKGYEGTIRKVVEDESLFLIGVVGTVKDLVDEGILIPADDRHKLDGGLWAFVPAIGMKHRVYFGGSRESALSEIE